MAAFLDELEADERAFVAHLALREVRGEDGARAAGLAVKAVKQRARARRFADLKRRVAAGPEECGDDEIRALVDDKKSDLTGEKGRGE